MCCLPFPCMDHMLWKAADGASLNPNPSVQPFLSKKILPSFLFIQAFYFLNFFFLLFSHLPPAALSLFWVLAQKHTQQQQQQKKSDFQLMVGLFLAGIFFSLQGWPQGDAVPVPLTGFFSAQKLQCRVLLSGTGDKYCRIYRAQESCPDLRPLAGKGWEKNEKIISLEFGEINWKRLIRSF